MILGRSAAEIDSMQAAFKSLKDEFAKTESMEWDALTVAGELVLQIGHLALTLPESNTGDNGARFAPQITSTADEFSDVIFNTFNLASFLSIRVAELDFTDSNRCGSTEWIDTLHATGSLLWDAVAKQLGYKAYVSDAEKHYLIPAAIIPRVLMATSKGIDTMEISTEVDTELEDIFNKSRDFIAIKSD